MVVDGAIVRIETTDHVEVGVLEVRTAVGRQHFAVVVDGHVFADFHFGETGGLATFVVVIEIGGKFEGFVFVFVQILQLGEPVAMAGFVMHEERERFALVSFLIQPMNGFVSNDVGEIAFRHVGTVGIVEVGVVVVALCGKDVPMVETGGLAHEVPLADQCGLVTGFLEQLGHGLLCAVENAVLVVSEPVFVGVLTGEHAGARRTTERIGDKRAGEFHAVLRHTVEVGGLNVAMIIGREHLCGVVVGHDIDDVVALLRGGTEGEQSGYDGKKFFLHDQREELKVLRFEGGALTCILFGRGTRVLPSSTRYARFRRWLAAMSCGKYHVMV